MGQPGRDIDVGLFSIQNSATGEFMATPGKAFFPGVPVILVPLGKGALDDVLVFYQIELPDLGVKK